MSNQPLLKFIGVAKMKHAIVSTVYEVLEMYRLFDISYVDANKYSKESLDNVSMINMITSDSDKLANELTNIIEHEFVQSPISEIGNVTIARMNILNEHFMMIQCICTADNSVGTIYVKCNRYNVDAIRLEFQYLDEFVEVTVRVINNNFVITNAQLSEKKRKFRRI